jgi:hypothetical protein
VPGLAYRFGHAGTIPGRSIPSSQVRHNTSKRTPGLPPSVPMMNRGCSRQRPAAAAAVLLIAVGLTLTACTGESSDAKAHRCEQAIEARTAGDKAKPKACDAISDDDYNTLNVAHALTSSGVVDSDGHVDLDKLLSPTDTP